LSAFLGGFPGNFWGGFWAAVVRVLRERSGNIGPNK